MTKAASLRHCCVALALRLTENEKGPSAEGPFLLPWEVLSGLVDVAVIVVFLFVLLRDQGLGR